MRALGASDQWASGDAYEPYVGRWSRAIARQFTAWLDVPLHGRWLDLGCGTGALSEVILETASPSEVVGIDPSAEYIAYFRAHTPDARVQLAIGDARALPVPSAAFDVAVAGLSLNFVPNPEETVAEMIRATRSEGSVGAYVWDYADGMELIRHFWDAATALDPSARDLDEGRRFANVCRPEALADLLAGAGLSRVQSTALVTPTVFRDFDDLWMPFLGGQGPAPGYAVSLTADQRRALRERLRQILPIRPDGSIPLTARAWAVRGRR